LKGLGMKCARILLGLLLLLLILPRVLH